MQANDDIIVGLDIGTTKICAVVGEAKGDSINIIGIGTGSTANHFIDCLAGIKGKIVSQIGNDVIVEYTDGWTEAVERGREQVAQVVDRVAQLAEDVRPDQVDLAGAPQGFQRGDHVLPLQFP